MAKGAPKGGGHPKEESGVPKGALKGANEGRRSRSILLVCPVAELAFGGAQVVLRERERRQRGYKAPKIL